MFVLYGKLFVKKEAKKNQNTIFHKILVLLSGGKFIILSRVTLLPFTSHTKYSYTYFYSSCFFVHCLLNILENMENPK